MTVTFGTQVFDCVKAVRDGEKANLYLAEGGKMEFRGVSDWDVFAFEDGGWDLHELKSERQEKNKAALADWLAAHPLTWTDGNVYGVTEEDQNEMSLNLQQYQVQVAAGRSVNLEWHTQKKQCHTFTTEQYTALLLAIIDYVYPYRRYQEAVKAAIYDAQTAEAVEAVAIDYGSVRVEEGDADV